MQTINSVMLMSSFTFAALTLSFPLMTWCPVVFSSTVTLHLSQTVCGYGEEEKKEQVNLL